MSEETLTTQSIESCLCVQDWTHKYAILKFFAKNGQIRPLDSECKFTLDSTNYDVIGCKRTLKASRIPYEGTFMIDYEGKQFEVILSKDNQYTNFKDNGFGSQMGITATSLLTMRNFEIRTNESNMDLVLSILENSINYEDESKNTKGLEIWYNIHDYWKKHSDTDQVQTLDHIFLPTNVSNEIVELIDTFIAMKERYYEFGITHKFTFLLEGKAGMGKSSIARSIANKYNRRLYMLNLGNREMKENDVIELFKNMKKDSILVLEDIDAFFSGRKTGTECATGISFSTLINLLDGNFSANNGLITFITANHPEQLDKALVRQGRIDKVVHFGEMSKDQFDAAWRARISKTEEPDDELFRICQRNKMSMSALMYVFFFGKTTEERRNMARQSVAERNFADSSSHMYS